MEEERRFSLNGRQRQFLLTVASLAKSEGDAVAFEAIMEALGVSQEDIDTLRRSMPWATKQETLGTIYLTDMGRQAVQQIKQAAAAEDQRQFVAEARADKAATDDGDLTPNDIKFIDTLSDQGKLFIMLAYRSDGANEVFCWPQVGAKCGMDAEERGRLALDLRQQKVAHMGIDYGLLQPRGIKAVRHLERWQSEQRAKLTGIIARIKAKPRKVSVEAAAQPWVFDADHQTFLLAVASTFLLDHVPQWELEEMLCWEHERIKSVRDDLKRLLVEVEIYPVLNREGRKCVEKIVEFWESQDAYSPTPTVYHPDGRPVIDQYSSEGPSRQVEIAALPTSNEDRELAVAAINRIRKRSRDLPISVAGRQIILDGDQQVFLLTVLLKPASAPGYAIMDELVGNDRSKRLRLAQGVNWLVDTSEGKPEVVLNEEGHEAARKILDYWKDQLTADRFLIASGGDPFSDKNPPPHFHDPNAELRKKLEQLEQKVSAQPKPAEQPKRQGPLVITELEKKFILAAWELGGSGRIPFRFDDVRTAIGLSDADGLEVAASLDEKQILTPVKTRATDGVRVSAFTGSRGWDYAFGLSKANEGANAENWTDNQRALMRALFDAQQAAGHAAYGPVLRPRSYAAVIGLDVEHVDLAHDQLMRRGALKRADKGSAEECTFTEHGLYQARRVFEYGETGPTKTGRKTSPVDPTFGPLEVRPSDPRRWIYPDRDPHQPLSYRKRKTPPTAEELVLTEQQQAFLLAIADEDDQGWVPLSKLTAKLNLKPLELNDLCQLLKWAFDIAQAAVRLNAHGRDAVKKIRDERLRVQFDQHVTNVLDKVTAEMPLPPTETELQRWRANADELLLWLDGKAAGSLVVTVDAYDFEVERKGCDGHPLTRRDIDGILSHHLTVGASPCAQYVEGAGGVTRIVADRRPIKLTDAGKHRAQVLHERDLPKPPQEIRVTNPEQFPRHPQAKSESHAFWGRVREELGTGVAKGIGLLLLCAVAAFASWLFGPNIVGAVKKIFE